uniref:Uncharacterized protein n=1 Tax=Aegilops tauschii subsp. strangulata TaxID=200361 RepID=A0A453FPN0_AEGTS
SGTKSDNIGQRCVYDKARQIQSPSPNHTAQLQAQGATRPFPSFLPAHSLDSSISKPKPPISITPPHPGSNPPPRNSGINPREPGEKGQRKNPSQLAPHGGQLLLPVG